MSCPHCQCCGDSGGKDGALSDGAKLVVSLASLLFGFAAGRFCPPPLYPLSDPSWIAVFLCAAPIYKSAFASILNGKITSNALVSAAMTGAFALQILALCGGETGGEHSSYIFVVGEIAFLMRLGSWLEGRTAAKAQKAVLSLSALAPKMALKKVGEAFEEVRVSEIAPGDILAVKPNCAVPADGIVIKGETSIDESAMTGESMPADKSAGSRVFAGTMNKSGYFEMRALKCAEDSAISRLAKAVEEAKGLKAPISRAADRWASCIVPAAILSAVAVFFAARYILGTAPFEAAVRAVTILVVFCPCAFVLATPTAIAAALGNLAKRGVLARSGGALESLAKTSSVFFDKTGTLTKAEIAVVGVYPENRSAEDVLRLAATAEKFSEHPIAKAIVSKFGDEPPSPENAESFAGVGVSCKIGETTIAVEKFRGEPKTPELAAAVGRGESLVKVSENGSLAGYIALSDTLRASAKIAVERLEKLGCKCAMLTGDARKAAENIAALAGIKNVAAELMPEDKLEFVRQAKARGERVCMVGDGVNDAPALAAADVSAAVADMKNDLAAEISDILLVGADIEKIPQAIEFSRKTIAVIKANMAFSVAANLAAVALSFFGIITPVVGALWHNASSVLVVSNSARLLKSK